MTETHTHYTTPGNHNLKVPSRDEFHRFASNLLSNADFCTDYPADYIIDKTSSALRWTIMNARNKQYLIWPKRRDLR